MNQKDFASSKVFYDNKNFPRGFARSGIFAKKEADLIERNGFAYQELTNGNREPSTDAETRFVKVMKGEEPIQTEHEKVWLKYLKHIGTRRVAYTTGMAFAMSDMSDSTDLDTD